MFRLLRLWRSPAREDADTFRQLARQGPDDLEWSIRRQSGVGRPPCWSRLRIGRSSEAINILGGAIRADHAAARPGFAWTSSMRPLGECFVPSPGLAAEIAGRP